ncbi:MAG: protease inhibitor I42 family protein [Candidatus Aadella gelida]|nr:protease inhibitor I42 family protein [Candidatus Aadella gelida]
MVAYLTVGQVLECRLEANPTTGFEWQVVQFGGNLKSVGPDEYVRRSNMVGFGGTKIFRFNAVKAGIEELKFEYLRAWEKGIPPGARYILRVNIK